MHYQTETKDAACKFTFSAISRTLIILKQTVLIQIRLLSWKTLIRVCTLWKQFYRTNPRTVGVFHSLRCLVWPPCENTLVLVCLSEYLRTGCWPTTEHDRRVSVIRSSSPVLQIRRGNRDNFGIISHVSP